MAAWKLGSEEIITQLEFRLDAMGTAAHGVAKRQHSRQAHNAHGRHYSFAQGTVSAPGFNFERLYLQVACEVEALRLLLKLPFFKLKFGWYLPLIQEIYILSTYIGDNLGA
jgi:hypothetical protein